MVIMAAAAAGCYLEAIWKLLAVPKARPMAAELMAKRMMARRMMAKQMTVMAMGDEVDRDLDHESSWPRCSRSAQG